VVLLRSTLGQDEGSAGFCPRLGWRFSGDVLWVVRSYGWGRAFIRRAVSGEELARQLLKVPHDPGGDSDSAVG